MADKSAIEWTDATWNPTVGCSILSPGCTNCYAMKMAGRLDAMGSPIYCGLTKKTKAGYIWNGKVEMSNHGQVIKPLSWRRPRRIFVNSMSDLFHESVPDGWIDRIFAVMALCPQHVFQVLTKRAARMRDYFAEVTADQALGLNRFGIAALATGLHGPADSCPSWPLPNCWSGVSVEDKSRSDRIPLLREMPAAVRFLSLEPLLEDLGALDLMGIDWVIVGGESGPGARPLSIEWVRSIIAQCKSAGVSCFVKQLGQAPVGIGYPFADYRLRHRKGGDITEFPEDLRIREYPQ